MLQTIVGYAVTAALGWLAKVIHSAWVDYQNEKKATEAANAKAQAAIQAAEDHDDTSGLFGGKPL
jgi:hypothetical protein